MVVGNETHTTGGIFLTNYAGRVRFVIWHLSRDHITCFADILQYLLKRISFEPPSSVNGGNIWIWHLCDTPYYKARWKPRIKARAARIYPCITAIYGVTLKALWLQYKMTDLRKTPIDQVIWQFLKIKLSVLYCLKSIQKTFVDKITWDWNFLKIFDFWLKKTLVSILSIHRT